MAESRCRVPYVDTDSIPHAVEVEAESLYEAVALAVSEFRDGEILTGTPGPVTEFSVTVLRKPIERRILFRKVHEWVRPSTECGPAGVVSKERLRKLINSSTNEVHAWL